MRETMLIQDIQVAAVWKQQGGGNIAYPGYPGRGWTETAGWWKHCLSRISR
jgi:hypothetical protein